MRGHYKLLRVGNGTMRAAQVSLVAEPSDTWSIDIPPSVEQVVRLYGDALSEGIMLAAKHHESLGGRQHRFTVESLVRTAADTLADAVRCAGAVAAWKALGHDEGDITMEFRGGVLELSFPPRPGSQGTP